MPLAQAYQKAPSTCNRNRVASGKFRRSSSGERRYGFRHSLWRISSGGVSGRQSPLGRASPGFGTRQETPGVNQRRGWNGSRSAGWRQHCGCRRSRTSDTVRQAQVGRSIIRTGPAPAGRLRGNDHWRRTGIFGDLTGLYQGVNGRFSGVDRGFLTGGKRRDWVTSRQVVWLASGAFRFRRFPSVGANGHSPLPARATASMESNHLIRNATGSRHLC